MAAVLAFDTTMVFRTLLGAVNNAGTLQTFAGGTLTPLATYSNSGLSAPNATTLTLTAGGKLSANVYISDATPYRFVMQTAGGSNIFITDQTFPAKFSVSPLGSVTALTNNPLTIMSGTGTPEGAITANIGSLYLRIDGGANTTLYVKESGAGNTGWIGK